MYKVISIALLLFASVKVQACDICGCGAGSSYFGVLPQLQRSFIGIKYQAQKFNSLPHDLDNHSYGPSYETFQNVELWGRWIPARNLQVFVSVPMKNNSRSTEQGHINLKGLGDIQLQMNYIIYQTPSTSAQKHKHLFQAGAGVKLPSGKHDQVMNQLFVNQNMQLGTGSWDMPFNFIYAYRNKNLGGNLEFTYRVNGANNMMYQFGNRHNLATTFLYWIESPKLMCLPQLGINWEQSKSDKRNHQLEEYTGYNALLANVGCDTYFSDFGVGAKLTQPIAQQISEGFTKSKTRFNVNFIYLFKTKKN